MPDATPLLSIIIAFYNDEHFIIDCLNSLFHQIDKDVQVILIDDGSTDSSNALVTELLKTYPDIRASFVTQPNQGVSIARNTGLGLANGEFVSFLDADDLLSQNYYAVIKPLLEADEDDLIDFNYQRFDTTPPDAPIEKTIQRIPYDFSNAGLSCLQPLFKRSMWHLWNRVYRRTLLEGERFELNRRYEDVIFTPFQYLKTQKIARLNSTLYYYRNNPHGITCNVKLSDINDMRFAMNKMVAYMQTHGNDLQLRQLAAGMLVNCFNEIKSMTKAVYGFYHYDAATKRDLKIAAAFCQGTDIPTKKILQMRFPEIDTCLSALRRSFNKNRRGDTTPRH